VCMCVGGCLVSQSVSLSVSVYERLCLQVNIREREGGRA
jgi:hypothetical protein